MAWIVQYQLNQNGDDAGPYGVDLTQSGGSWSSNAGGYGYTTTLESSNRLSGVMGSAAAAALSGLQKFSIVVQKSTAGTFWEGSPILNIGNTLGVAAGSAGGHDALLWINSNIASAYIGNANLFVITVDTTQASALDRVRVLYLENGAITSTGPDEQYIPQNAAISTLTSSSEIVVGNHPGDDRSQNGTLWFVGLWDDALNDADAEAMLSALELDHDNDPSGAGSADLHITIPQLMRYSGSAFDDVADEELDVDIYAVDQSTLKVTGLLFSTTVEIPVDPEEPVYLHDNRLGAAGTIRGVAFPYSAAGEDSLAMLMLEVEEGEGHEDDD